MSIQKYLFQYKNIYFSQKNIQYKSIYFNTKIYLFVQKIYIDTQLFISIQKYFSVQKVELGSTFRNALKQFATPMHTLSPI